MAKFKSKVERQMFKQLHKEATMSPKPKQIQPDRSTFNQIYLTLTEEQRRKENMKKAQNTVFKKVLRNRPKNKKAKREERKKNRHEAHERFAKLPPQRTSIQSDAQGLAYLTRRRKEILSGRRPI